jgi:hypothetical protein
LQVVAEGWGAAGNVLTADALEDQDTHLQRRLIAAVVVCHSCVQVMAEGWWAAGNVPTAEDRLVRALLLGYTLLTELAPGEALVTEFITVMELPWQSQTS